MARRGALTRRQTVAGAGIGVAASLLAGRAGLALHQDAKTIRQADVVIVGAGFAGLAAARRLREAALDIVVLEARDRVGGRVLNHDLGNGEIVEAGGQYIGPTQTRLQDLADTFGIETFPAFTAGRNVANLTGERIEGDLPAEVLAEYHDVVNRINTLASEVPLDAPWEAARAEEWDSITAYTWLQTQKLSPETMALFSIYGDLWGAEMRDVSFLYMLFYTAAAGNEETPGDFNRLVTSVNGAQERRFIGGSQLLAIAMAEELQSSLILDAPVRRIAWHDDGVTVSTDALDVEASSVIIAIPPPLVLGITFDPPLPRKKSQLLQRFPGGSLMKVEAIYDRPFWREAGLSGSSGLAAGPVRETFDNTPPSGSPGILFGFIGGHASRQWGTLTPEERRNQVLDCFAEVVGQAARDAIDYLEIDWPGEPWSRSGPVSFLPPGVLLDYGQAIRPPVGAIHWAGTETATYWNGYMEGAVRSGERAAEEVLARYQLAATPD